MSVESAELARMAALSSFDILNTPQEEAFDALARLAASVCMSPAAVIGFQDGEREWLKSRVGLAANRTTHDSGLKFRADVSLTTSDGYRIGAIAILDYVPRALDPVQEEALRELAEQVMAQLELRRRLAQFRLTNPACRANRLAIGKALQDNEFVLHYQPTIDVRTGHIAGLEGLIRWQHPEHGLIAPRYFMPFLEDSGLIVKVGAWVIEQAARDYRLWLSHGVAAPRVSVNISPVQFRHPDFVTALERALDPDGMSRVPVDIEISDDLLHDGNTACVDRLRELQQLGIQVTLDDLGIGSASARHLSRLPIDTVKIDRSLIRAMTRGPDDMDLVANLISMAHDQGLQVIAAGVETEEQRKFLRFLRCELMQGFFFAQPVPAAEVERLLKGDQGAAAAEWALVMGDLS